MNMFLALVAIQLHLLQCSFVDIETIQKAISAEEQMVLYPHSQNQSNISGLIKSYLWSPSHQLQKLFSSKTKMLSLCYKCSTVPMHPELLLVELVQQCGQDLESFLHDRERTVLIVSMVDTAVAIATHLGRERRGQEGGREGGGRREGGKGRGGEGRGGEGREGKGREGKGREREGKEREREGEKREGGGEGRGGEGRGEEGRGGEGRGGEGRGGEGRGGEGREGKGREREGKGREREGEKREGGGRGERGGGREGGRGEVERGGKKGEGGREGGEGGRKELVTYYIISYIAVFHIDLPVHQTLPAGGLQPVGGCQ